MATKVKSRPPVSKTPATRRTPRKSYWERLDYFKAYEKSKRAKVRRRKYRQSPKGKAAQARWKQTERGRELMRGYAKTPKARARRAAACRKYRTTQKGRIAAMRHHRRLQVTRSIQKEAKRREKANAFGWNYCAGGTMPTVG